MAFTFNGASKTITHSGGTLSVLEMWSRYVDWLAIGDNSKYGALLNTVGRDKPDIPLYVFLELGVTIVVTNNTIPTVVTDGVLKTSDDSDPFGGATVNVRYEKPGIAIGYSTTGGSGPSAESIAAAVITALRNATPLIPVNVKNIKDQTVAGSGTKADPWRPV